MLMQLSRHTLSGRRRGSKVGDDMMSPSWGHCTNDEEPLFVFFQRVRSRFAQIEYLARLKVLDS